MPLRTSYSSRELFRTCERKYQLTKLVGTKPAQEYKDYFSHGHGFGEGVAHYLLTGSKTESIFKCWMAYWPIVDTEEYNAYVSCVLLEAAFFKLDKIRADYEVAIFNGKPAVELSARININADIYDIAFIDVVLRHRATGKYAIFECKSTSLNLTDLDPAYRNSGQGLGYSIILDAIAGADQASFEVIYFVGQMKQKRLDEIKFHVFHYQKTLKDRLDWFLTLGIDIEALQKMLQFNYFPMRNKCLAYNKVCTYFGNCHLRKTDQPRPVEPDTNTYQFEFFLDDIVADHVKRIQNMIDANEREQAPIAVV